MLPHQKVGKREHAVFGSHLFANGNVSSLIQPPWEPPVLPDGSFQHQAARVPPSICFSRVLCSSLQLSCLHVTWLWHRREAGRCQLCASQLRGTSTQKIRAVSCWGDSIIPSFESRGRATCTELCPRASPRGTVFTEKNSGCTISPMW